jgi:hypothetical protein
LKAVFARQDANTKKMPNMPLFGTGEDIRRMGALIARPALKQLVDGILQL